MFPFNHIEIINFNHYTTAMRKVKSTIAAMGASLLTLLLMVTAALPASAQFTKTINGYLSVTGLDGTVSTVTSALVASEDTITKNALVLDFGKAVINGFEIEDLKLEGIKYSLNGAASLDATESIQLLSTSPANSFSFAGANVEIGISNSPASLIYLNEDEESTELNFTITFAGQEMTMSAVFTTLKPADFEDPNAPVAGEVIEVKGRMNLTINNVLYHIEKSISIVPTTEVDDNGKFMVDITIPELVIENEDTEISIEGYTISEVSALRRGAVITFDFATEKDEKGEVKPIEIETVGGNLYKVANLSGAINDNGAAAVIYTLTTDKNVKVAVDFNNDPGQIEVYSGKLDVDMGDLSSAEGLPANVEIITVEGQEGVTFLLPNFCFGEWNLGDIRVDNVSVKTDDNGTREYQGSEEGMEFLGGFIKADVTLNGTITEEGHAVMTIDVIWIGGITGTEDTPIKVTFVGDLNDSTTGIVAPEAPAVMEGPAEYFNINGMRVSEGNLIPGIYIERRGNQARKILVK